MAVVGKEHAQAPLVVATHVTPWGFLVALPLALAFAVLGAQAVDAPIVPVRLGMLVQPPAWLFGALLLGFAGFLFLIGVAELATYLKPSVEVVIDSAGLMTSGVLGWRHVAWGDVRRLDLDRSHLTVHARGRTRGTERHLRLHFSRLAVEPAELLARIRDHRPDLMPAYRTT